MVDLLKYGLSTCASLILQYSPQRQCLSYIGPSSCLAERDTHCIYKGNIASSCLDHCKNGIPLHFITVLHGQWMIYRRYFELFRVLPNSPR